MIKQLIINLKLLREKKKISQTIISEYIGYEFASSLSHVESGRKNVSSNSLLKWLLILGVNLNNIVSDANAGVDFDLLHQAVQKKIDINKLIREAMKNDK